MICNSAEGFDMRAVAKSRGVMAVASRSTLGRLNPQPVSQSIHGSFRPSRSKKTRIIRSSE
jgi:hypothetical protein